MATKITDFAANARLWQALGPIQTGDTTVTTAAIDLIDGDGPAFAIVCIDAADGSPTLSGAIQASDDAATWSAVDGATIAAATDLITRSITFQRPKRYLRAVLTISNGGDPVTLSVLLGQSRKLM